MFTLFKNFIRNPTNTFFEQLESLSKESGLWIYVFYISFNFLGNPKTFDMTRNIISKAYGIDNEFGLYFYFLISIALSVVSIKYINPFLISKLLNKDRKAITNDYEKIMYLAVVPQAILKVVFNLPLLIIASVLISLDLGTLSVGLIMIESLGGFLGFILLIQCYLMIWNGTKSKFETTNKLTFLIVFIIPLLMSIPFILLFGDAYWEIISNYIKK